MNKIKELLKNPLYQQYRDYIMPVLSFVVSVTLIVLVIFPQIPQIGAINIKIEEIQAKTDSLTQKAGILERVDEDDYKAFLNTASQVLPSDRNIPNAIDNILRLVNANRLDLTAINFSNNSIKSGGLDAFSVKLSLAGNLEGVKAFVDGVKELPRLMKVNTIEIIDSGKPVVGERARPPVSADIELLIFFQPVLASIGGVESPISQPSEQQLAQIQELQAKIVPFTTAPVTSGERGKSNPFQ